MVNDNSGKFHKASFRDLLVWVDVGGGLLPNQPSTKSPCRQSARLATIHGNVPSDQSMLTPRNAACAKGHFKRNHRRYTLAYIFCFAMARWIFGAAPSHCTLGHPEHNHKWFYRLLMRSSSIEANGDAHEPWSPVLHLSVLDVAAQGLQTCCWSTDDASIRSMRGRSLVSL